MNDKRRFYTHVRGAQSIIIPAYTDESLALSLVHNGLVEDAIIGRVAGLDPEYVRKLLTCNHVRSYIALSCLNDAVTRKRFLELAGIVTLSIFARAYACDAGRIHTLEDIDEFADVCAALDRKSFKRVA